MFALVAADAHRASAFYGFESGQGAKISRPRKGAGIFLAYTTQFDTLQRSCTPALHSLNYRNFWGKYGYKNIPEALLWSHKGYQIESFFFTDAHHIFHSIDKTVVKVDDQFDFSIGFLQLLGVFSFSSRRKGFNGIFDVS